MPPRSRRRSAKRSACQRRTASSPRATARTRRSRGESVTRNDSRKPAPSLKAVAIRLLARRDYGRAELSDRLLARGGASDDVRSTLDELERLGYLSDARFATALVAQRAGRYGKRAIAHELRQKQVAPAAAQDALAALAGADELAEATALWQRRFGVVAKDDRERARQVRFLMARGYAMSIALKIVRQGGPADADPTPETT